MSNIFYLMGKSSSGKDTLYRKLMEQNRLLKGIVSYTTRPQRAGETDGKEYFFVAEDEMKAMEQKGIVIEKRVYHTIYGDWSYFTADDGQIQENGCDYLLIGTLESYMKVKKYYGEKRVFPVYIEVEDGIRLKRAIEREMKQKKPNYEELCRRFLADNQDFCEENIQKCGIEQRFSNYNADQCIREIRNYIKKNQK